MSEKKGSVPGKRTVSEREVEAALVRMIVRNGGRCLKWVSPGSNGMPDRICLLPGGRILFAEVKRPGGRIAPIQRIRADELKELGFRHVFVCGFEEIERLEKELWN